jgi:hypothetical protein
MVLEVTGIGQLEFGFLFIFSFLLPHEHARRRRCGNVGIRPLGAGFPSPAERMGNSFWEFSTLSTGRHFHSARSGCSERSDVRRGYRPLRFHLTTPGGGTGVRAVITPDASCGDRGKAFEINLRCISSIAGCAELREIMPSVWIDHEEFLRLNTLNQALD